MDDADADKYVCVVEYSCGCRGEKSSVEAFELGRQAGRQMETS